MQTQVGTGPGGVDKLRYQEEEEEEVGRAWEDDGTVE
jgi:hypothetical protein